MHGQINQYHPPLGIKITKIGTLPTQIFCARPDSIGTLVQSLFEIEKGRGHSSSSSTKVKGGNY